MLVTRYSARRAAPSKSMAPSGVMGVIIAVTMRPNGALVVVIPERYPQPGARSRRLTAWPARNPARLEAQGSGRGRTVRHARASRKYDQPCAQTPAKLVNRVPAQYASQR